MSDAKDAVRDLEERAKQGDAKAMVRLGLNSLRGLHDTTQNPQLAKKWFEQAVELGSAEALAGLGSFYLQDRSVGGGIERAVAYFEAAADKGSAWGAVYAASCYADIGNDAAGAEVLKRFVENPTLLESEKTVILNKLAKHYEVGEGVEQDYSTALDYHKRAGYAGSIDSMLRLAAIYEAGEGGITKDAEESKRWRNAADLAREGKSMTRVQAAVAKAFDAFDGSEGCEVLEHRVEPGAAARIRPVGLG